MMTLKTCHETNGTSGTHKFGNFNSSYSILDKISKGSYGTVYRCKKNGEKGYRAVKVINSVSMIDEVELIRDLQHKNMIHFYESFVEKKKIYIVMELCGHDLFDEIMNDGGKINNEQKIKTITRQILEGIRYLHSKDIVHRDLKLSNILFDGQNCVKIIDFGLSIRCKRDEYLEQMVGTNSFVSPEIIMGSYDRRCDIWALGCIVFIMFFGFNPFNTTSKRTIESVNTNILKGFRNETLRGYGAFFPINVEISDLGKNFIASLLTDVTTRLTPDEALQHPWLN